VLEVILVQLFALVFIARVAGLLCERARIPVIIGEIVAGIIISNVFISGSSLFTALQLGNADFVPVFQVFANLGIIFLLFAVGLVTPFSELRKIGGTATLVAVLGVILPFIFGTALILAFQFDLKAAIFVGAAMVATSVGITARVIGDLGLMGTVEARVIIAAAVIDDILGLIVLAVVAGVAKGGTLNLVDTAVVAGLAVAFVLTVMFISVLIKRMRKKHPLIRSPEDIEKKRWSPLPLALIACFGLAAMASYLNLAAIVGAFLAGMLFAEFRDVWPTEEKFGPINEFLVPFFFLSIGMQVSLGALANGIVPLIAILLISIAIVTKLVGCGIGAHRLGRRSAVIVGVGMIPRGEVGVLVASIGLSAAILTPDLYAVVVAMSLATTLLAPYLVSYAFNKKSKRSSKFEEITEA
jgi:Kef-type K+ transport system membrane component KefB